jgi:hypothetical protein
VNIAHRWRHGGGGCEECPICGRRFVSPGHAVVAEESSGFITFGFKSKQTNLWGIARVPVEGFTWGPSHKEAWAIQNRKDGRTTSGLKEQPE